MHDKVMHLTLLYTGVAIDEAFTKRASRAERSFADFDNQEF